MTPDIVIEVPVDPDVIITVEGLPGAPGDPGPANELSIGTVTTGAAGSPASATITGTPPTQVLDLTIPRGDTGDVPAARTITAGTGLTGGGTLAADRTIGIANGGVGTTQLADDSVTTGKIAAGAVGTTDIADDAVTQPKIGPGAVGTTELATDAVTTAKITDGAVTDGKLAGSITPSKVSGTALVASLLDAKGDLIAAGGNDTPARLPVGANGTLLVADSTAATGVAWRAPSPITASAVGVTLDRANPVYTFTGGSVTATLPTAATHAGVRFLIRNAGTGTVTVAGITGLTIPGVGYVDVVSDGTAWMVLEGDYATNVAGLASYHWNQVTSAWRLVAYDSGWRDISALLVNGWTGTLQCRLRGWTVLYRTGLGAAALNGTSASATTALPMSSVDAAFRNDASGRRVFVYNSFTAAILPAAVGSDAIIMPAVGSTALYNFLPEARFAWVGTLPTSLPGIQVTAPA